MKDDRSQDQSQRKPSMDVTAFLPANGNPAAMAIPGARLPSSLSLGSMWGKYRIVAVLGKGGGGAVYEAQDTLIQRQVAIKMLPPEMAGDPALLARFKAEAQAAGRLNHPNVITIYEIMEIDGVYAIVMECADGGSMQDYLQRRGSPGWKSSSRLAGEACKALIVAHEAGLVHRDIKPANLLLTKEGHVKVADFGLAKSTNSDVMQTQAGAIMGTPAYMSPEQCRGDKIDHRTDIYSLGCTYFAMLSGKPPFEAASSLQVMFSHCSAPIPNPCDLNPDVPQACADILNRALAKNPADRYATAKEMFNDLRTVIGGGTVGGPTTTAQLTMLDQPAIAMPPSWEQIRPQRQRPPFWKNKWVAIAAGGAVVAAVASIATDLFANRQPPPEPQAQTRPATLMPAVTVAKVTPAAMPTPAPLPVKAPPIVTTKPAPTTLAARPLPSPATQVALGPKPVVPPTPAAQPAAHPPVPDNRPGPPSAPVPFDPARLKTLPLKITNSIHQDLMLIKPGKFTMGDAALADAPPHEVTLTQPYYMGVLEVKQSEFDEVMGAEPGAPTAPRNMAAPFVSWDDATEFCRRLSDLPAEKAAHRVYRLPTEAEWEYACRAGTKTKFSTGRMLEKNQANFGKSPDILNNRPEEPPAPPSEQRPPRPGERPQRGQRPQPPNRNEQRSQLQSHPLDPAGIFPANAFGLKDMHGSVWEWCSDFYSPTAYKDGPHVDPTGPAKGDHHVARGGCWSSPADQCESAFRNGKLEVTRQSPNVGFRIVCDVPPPSPAAK